MHIVATATEQIRTKRYRSVHLINYTAEVTNNDIQIERLSFQLGAG